MKKTQGCQTPQLLRVKHKQQPLKAQPVLPNETMDSRVSQPYYFQPDNSLSGVCKCPKFCVMFGSLQGSSH